MYGFILVQGDKEIFKSIPDWSTIKEIQKEMDDCMSTKSGSYTIQSASKGNPIYMIPATLMGSCMIKIYKEGEEVVEETKTETVNEK